MQGWMIALLVIGCFVALLVIAFFIGVYASLRYVLGRKTKPPKESAEDYGVDVSWFDTLEIKPKTLEITSYDGLKLRAMLITHGEKPNKVAIAHHGYGATPRSMQPQAKMFFERGFDVLLPAARAHSDSEGSYIGMAWLDRFDLLRWVDKIISEYGKNVSIALAGTSMGGATVIAAAGMNPPPQVKLVIDDCGFSSQVEEYAACIKNIKLPLKLILFPLSVGVKLKLGYSIYDADITTFASKMNIPALFIHGEDDTYVPYALGKKLYESCASVDKEFFAVPNAGHALAYAKAPEKYEEVFGAFIDKHIR